MPKMVLIGTMKIKVRSVLLMRPGFIEEGRPLPASSKEDTMPVRSGDALDPAATRRRILSISERAFYERGIAAVSVADIAEAAAASKASIYKNFGSKEGLVEATLADRSERVHRWLAEDTAHLPPGRDRVLGVFDLLVNWYAEADFRGCAMVSAAAEERVSNSTVTALARRHLQAYRDFLTTCLQEANISNPGQFANRLLILIEGATIISAIDGSTDAGREARALADALLPVVDHEAVDGGHVRR